MSTSFENKGFNQFNRNLLLKEGGNGEMVFGISDEFMRDLESKRCELVFILENRFAQRYKEKFILIITHISTSMSCDCRIQEYEVERCE